MPGRLQRDSLSTALPIENSPPGIQTIPGGTGTGTEFAFGIVGPNVAEASTAAVVADTASRGLAPLRAYTVNAPTVIKANVSKPLFLFMVPSTRCFVFRRRAHCPCGAKSASSRARNLPSLFLEGKNTVPIALHADNHPPLLLRFVIQCLCEC